PLPAGRLLRPLLERHGDAERRGHRLVLPGRVVNGGHLLPGRRVLPGREVEADAGAHLRGAAVVSLPGDLAAAGLFLVLDVEPVADVLAVDDGDDRVRAVLVVDAVLPDRRVVLDVP